MNTNDEEKNTNKETENKVINAAIDYVIANIKANVIERFPDTRAQGNMYYWTKNKDRMKYFVNEIIKDWLIEVDGKGDKFD